MKYCHDCKYFSTHIEESPCKECWAALINKDSENYLTKPYFEPKEDDE